MPTVGNPGHPRGVRRSLVVSPCPIELRRSALGADEWPDGPLAQRMEEVSTEEMERRMRAAYDS